MNSLFTYHNLEIEIGEQFGNPLLKDSYFVRSGSCERGICVRLVSLDSARGVYALPCFLADLADGLFYCAGFGF